MTIKISKRFDTNSSFNFYPGDIREFLKQVPDNFYELVVTSPPYNIGKEYEKKVDLDRYVSQQKEIITECVRTLSSSGSICWQVGNYVDKGAIIPIDILLFPIFHSLGLKLRNRIVWKFGHGLHASKRLSGRYEVILWFTKSDKYTFNLDPIRVPQKYPNKKHFKGPRRGELSGNPLGKNPSDIWDIPNVKANHVEKTIHPCQFPVELIERLVLSMTNKGDWVLDPFMGVGTTAVASLMHERNVAGAETYQEYYDIAVNRVRKAEEGELRIRPMERPVYSVGDKNIPPKFIKIGSQSIQKQLLEDHEDYEGTK